MDDFEKLIRLFDKRFYGDVIMAFFELAAIITCLLFIRKDKTAVFFLAYLFFDLLILLSGYYIEFLPTTSAERTFFFAFTNSLVSLAELLVYYYFFFKIIHIKVVIRLMKFFRIIFIGIIVIFIPTQFKFFTKRYFYVFDMIGVIEFLFLLLPCFAYYYELLKNDPVINLYKRPSFWIVTGIFLYSVISAPYYLIERFVVTNHYEYSHLLDLAFFYVPFTINFIFLTKAFLCKKTLTI